MFFGMTGVPDLETRIGTFSAYSVAEDSMDQLVLSIQERMGRLEREVAGLEGGRDGREDGEDGRQGGEGGEGAGSGHQGGGGRAGGEAGDGGGVGRQGSAGDGVSGGGRQDSGGGDSTGEGGLLVVDGPLRGTQRLKGAVGYIKSHRVHYLPAELRGILVDLEPGERTPVFLLQTTWSRFTWYLKLADAGEYPGAGVVRLETWSEVGLEGAKRLADATALTLPRFSSEPHKDERAPQNLYPIAGLERELGRRLGDRLKIHRALQQAVAGWRAVG